MWLIASQMRHLGLGRPSCNQQEIRGRKADAIHSLKYIIVFEDTYLKREFREQTRADASFSFGEEDFKMNKGRWKQE